MRRRDVPKVLFSAVLHFACFAGAVPPSHAVSTPAFYPGVSESQSMAAHEALRAYYNGNTERSDRVLRDMERLERRDSLPPLSRLLQTATLGLTLQRDDAGGAEAAMRLRARLDSAADSGLARCARRANPDDPTCLVIEGGIIGFRAILKLDDAPPTEVLGDGLKAVERLEKALAIDSTVIDAHMGLGIFHVMAASNTPLVVRALLRVMGRGVSVREGLAHLRKSGYEGQYTTVASQFYLIRFLSPYDDELRREKTEIFRSLRKTVPLSSLTLFLRGHEFLCFHPDSFYIPDARAALARRIRAVDARALMLVKYQYTLLDSAPPPRYAPDTTFDLGGYAFYPQFIEALRLRRRILAADAAGTPRPDRADAIRHVAALRKELTTRIRAAALSPQNRRHLEWQVRDALRPELFDAARATGGQDDRDARDAPGAAVSTSKAAGKSRGPADR